MVVFKSLAIMRTSKRHYNIVSHPPVFEGAQQRLVRVNNDKSFLNDISGLKPAWIQGPSASASSALRNGRFARARLD